MVEQLASDAPRISHILSYFSLVLADFGEKGNGESEGRKESGCVIGLINESNLILSERGSI